MNPLQPEKNSPLGTEFLVLRALCQGTKQGSVRDSGIQLLQSYTWREAVHQAIYNCLVHLASANLEQLRSLLPACLTRKGFPAVEWEALFEPHSLTRQDAERLMRELTPRL